MIEHLTRLYPFYSGNYQIINSHFVRRFLKVPVDRAWCSAPGGAIIVPTKDEVGRCIFFTGDYDRKLTWLCRRIIRRGDTVIDVGANLGLVTLTMANCVGPAGRVHAFEPNPELQGLIEQSLQRNFYRNVTLHKTALGREKSALTLHVPAWNLGQGSFVYHEQIEGASHHLVQVETLSDVARREGIETIRMLKIDVEGYENDVLLGAKSILGEIRPDVVIFESNELQQPDFRDRPVTRTLRELDYRFLSIPKALVFMSLQPFDPERVSDPGHDIVAVPSEKYDGVLSLTSPR